MYDAIEVHGLIRIFFFFFSSFGTFSPWEKILGSHKLLTKVVPLDLHLH